MKFILLLLFFCQSAIGATSLSKHLDILDKGDLDKIIKKKYIRVLTTRNPYDYYIYQGRSSGMQYEMTKKFVEHLNSKFVKKDNLKIVFEIIPVDFEQLIPMLNEGKGDIIAVGLTQTPERDKLITFSHPYRVVDDVIVTRKELVKDSWFDKKFAIQKKSSFYYSLKNKYRKVKIDEVNPNFHGATILDLISLKKYDYTLMNSFWAETITKQFENLAIIKDVPFRKDVKISWAVRKNNPQLLAEINSFLPKVQKGTLLGNLFSYKYFYDIGRINSANFSLEDSQISQYDNFLKQYGKKYNLDWRFLAALCFQESRFNQDIVNKWGAIGLFQVKQMTANEPYINIPKITGQENFENNIHAGVKYLAWIKNRYFDSNPNMTEENRLRMTMAAYNAGPRRVLQAINKAKKMGLDTNKWFRNVELAMLKLGYPEPVIYVSEINKHYVSYLLLGL